MMLEFFVTIAVVALLMGACSYEAKSAVRTVIQDRDK